MRRQLSFQQYRTLDLMLFAAILLVSETVILTAATRWYPDQLYTVSVTGAVTAIVLMRWGPFGLIHCVLGCALFCFLSGGTLQHYCIYLGGCLPVVLPWLALEKLGHERVRQDAFLSVGLALAVQLSLQLGRALMALCLGAPPGAALRFLSTDVLSGLFSGVIIWIARRLDGLFEDQKHYLLRIHRES